MDANRFFDHLHARFSTADYPFPDDAPPAPFPNADRYVLASLVQKAIRRGDTQIARRAAHQLLKSDPARLWRRLRVVALEDIGIGDCKIAADLIGIASIVALRRNLGGNARAVDVAIARGCAAIKDRTCDHFGSVAREPHTADDGHSLVSASHAALIAVLISSSQAWPRRVQAIDALYRRLEARPAVQRRAALEPVFDSFRDNGAPEFLVAACQAYAARERNPLALYALLAWSLWQTSGAHRSIAKHTLVPSEDIAGIPDYAFDPHHTRIGRRAVELWRNSHLERPPWTARQIAVALWNSEAAACDQTLDWPLAEAVRSHAHQTDLIISGVQHDQHDRLTAWIAQHRASLVCARRGAWKSTTR